MTDSAERAAIAIGAAAVVGFVALAMHGAHARGAEDDALFEPKPLAIEKAPRTALSVDANVRTCPPGGLCPIVLRKPLGVIGSAWDGRRTLILDGYQAGAIEKNEFHELAVTPRGAIADAIVRKRKGKPPETIMIDRTGSVFAIDEKGASRMLGTAGTPVGTSSDARLESASMSLALSGDELWAVVSGHLYREADDRLEEIALPGFGEDPSKGSIEDARERNRRTRIVQAFVAFRAPGDGVIVYDEPSGLSRSVARAYAWEHGLTTELFGLEDTEITRIAIGGPGELYFSAIERADRKVPPVYFVGRFHEGKVERVFQGPDPILGIGTRKSEACIVTTGPTEHVTWLVTKDQKVQDTHVVEIPAEPRLDDAPPLDILRLRGDVSAPTMSARCDGDRRLTVTGGTWALDFDGARTTAVTLHDLHPEIARFRAVWVEKPGVYQLFASDGIHRISGGAITKISDQLATHGQAIHRAVDGSVAATIDGALHRWNGSAWVDPQPLHRERVMLFLAPGRHVVSADVPYGDASGLYLDDKPWPHWDSKRFHPTAGIGTIDEAWIAASGNGDEEGGLFHWGGKTFSKVDPIPTLRSVFGLAPNDLYAVGHDRVFHYDGASWQSVLSVGGAFYAMFQDVGRSGHPIFLEYANVAELDGDALRRSPLRFDGSAGPGTLAFEPGATLIAVGDALYRRPDPK